MPFEILRRSIVAPGGPRSLRASRLTQKVSGLVAWPIPRRVEVAVGLARRDDVDRLPDHRVRADHAFLVPT
jgi:hypothetical protein